MNVLVVNPIVYTSEIKTIKRAGSIKDTMIYDLCLAFMEKGHQVVLYAAEPFKPLSKERYPFQVIWGKCVFQKICQPYRLPFMPGLFRYIKEHEDIDLIICSEVFSLTTLNSVWAANKKVIVWHELAEHNAMMHQIPSKIWYNIVPRLFMRDTKVVARSKGAYTFICQFCRSTVNEIIGHGVDLNRFLASKEKKDYFIVCSRLTKRKRIDGILYSFKMYVDLYENRTKLFIIGDGDQRVSLEKLTRDLHLSDRVVFTGKMSHDQLIPFLSHALAMLVNTGKDNSLLSIVESLAVGTPVITTDIPLDAPYIKEHRLGIAKAWDHEDLKEMVDDNPFYVQNCLDHRNALSTYYKVDRFIKIYSECDER